MDKQTAAGCMVAFIVLSVGYSLGFLSCWLLGVLLP